jgi:hypothetical protein
MSRFRLLITVDATTSLSSRVVIVWVNDWIEFVKRASTRPWF